MVTPTKKCPMCAEAIPADAQVCPFCSQPISTPPLAAYPSAQSAPPSQTMPIWAWILIAVAILVCVICFVAGAGLWIYRANLAPSPAVATPEVTLPAQTVENPMADGNSIGDPNAPVKVDIWGDFQCSACVRFTQNIEPLIIQTYVETGKVTYTFHFFPFISSFSPGNTESEDSANASLCAAEQGKFWEYHAILFANWNGENTGAFSDDKLIAFASTLGLNMGDFRKCVAEHRYRGQIETDYSTGQAMGITGVPTIFVAGQRVKSASGENYIPNFTEISSAIEAALEAAGSD
jgi:protein-disulfide isomerase